MICKYFTLNGDFYNSISNNYLWFSNPLDFNDPYDCNLKLDFDNTEDELRLFFKSSKNNYVLKNDDRGLTIDVEEKTRAFLNNPDLMREKIHDIFVNQIVSSYGICSFSENDQSLLMWSHYADKHKGVCLVFDVKSDLSFFSTPFKVEYQSKYPKINYVRDKINEKPLSSQSVFATKSKDWEYEDEIRIIKDIHSFNEFRGEIYFNKTCLVEVIFGYKLSKDKEKTNFLKDYFKGFGYNIEFSEIKLKDHEFGLEKLRYKDQ